MLADMCEIWIADVESHVNTGQVTKTTIFENFTFGGLPTFKKKVLSLYLRC